MPKDILNAFIGLCWEQHGQQHSLQPPLPFSSQDSCLYKLNPCLPPSSSNSCAGQVSNTPHHRKMKLVIQNTRPCVPSLPHPLHQLHYTLCVCVSDCESTYVWMCLCVVRQTAIFCYSYPVKLIGYCPSWDCLKRSFVLLKGRGKTGSYIPQ